MRNYGIDFFKENFPDSTLLGNHEAIFNFIKNNENIDSKCLDWVSINNKNKESYLNNSKANVIICDRQIKIPTDVLKHKLIVKVDDPRLVFSKVFEQICSIHKAIKVSNSAIIHPEAIIGKKVNIGHNVVIGKSIIADGCQIMSNSVILDNVSIDKNSNIGYNCTIGGLGFGFTKDKYGKYFRFPHLSGVKIGKNVEIGSNTCIDQGALTDTIVSDGVKIDNLVQIAHNVEIGKDTLIMAKVMISGSTKIGKNCWIGPSSVITNSVSIGAKSYISIGSVVANNIKPGSRVSGNFAINHNKFLINHAKSIND